MSDYAPPSLRLEELTSPEVGDALAAGFTSVVVACGAVEQHGPYIAMVSDALHGGAAALGAPPVMGPGRRTDDSRGVRRPSPGISRHDQYPPRDAGGALHRLLP